MNYGLRVVLPPQMLNSLSDEGFATIGRMSRTALTRELEKDGLWDSVKQGGLAIEIYYKDLTEEEKVKVKEMATAYVSKK